LPKIVERFRFPAVQRKSRKRGVFDAPRKEHCIQSNPLAASPISWNGNRFPIDFWVLMCVHYCTEKERTRETERQRKREREKERKRERERARKAEGQKKQFMRTHVCLYVYVYA